LNYLNNVGKGKQIREPIVFQGGVSKNSAVVREFEKELGAPVYVDPNGHLMGALGMAVLAKREKTEAPFDFNIANMEFKTVGTECTLCANNCEIINVYRGKTLVDSWGNKCDRGGTKE